MQLITLVSVQNEQSDDQALAASANSSSFNTLFFSGASLCTGLGVPLLTAEDPGYLELRPKR
jgi:hypothetical protein